MTSYKFKIHSLIARSNFLLRKNNIQKSIKEIQHIKFFNTFLPSNFSTDEYQWSSLEEDQ